MTIGEEIQAEAMKQPPMGTATYPSPEQFIAASLNVLIRHVEALEQRVDDKGGSKPGPVTEWSRTDQRMEDMERESEEIYRELER